MVRCSITFSSTLESVYSIFRKAAKPSWLYLDELQKNLTEVLELCLEEYQGTTEDLPRFVGLQQIEVGE
jgi:hypothetical protein